MASTWLITGASSGFGRLLAERLLERGDRVAAMLRNPVVLRQLQDQYGDALWVGRLDVTDRAATRDVIAAAFHSLGQIDVVVSNAGFGVFGAAEELTDEQIEQVIDTNLLGSIRVIRAALPHLRAQRRGRILQVSAAGRQTVSPNFGAYHASKWGIEGFCETVAIETASLGIQVTISEPGATPTGFSSAVQFADAMPEYAHTPAGQVRAAIETGSFVFPNDPDKLVRAMLEMVDSGAAPMRLTLGTDAYTDVHASLTQRLEALEAQREVAESVVAD